jgi:hypothetical protein
VGLVGKKTTWSGILLSGTASGELPVLTASEITLIEAKKSPLSAGSLWNGRLIGKV